MITPSSSIFLISRRTISLGKRYSGIPNMSTPPGSGSISKISTLNPWRERSPAIVSPAGPEPITATRPRVFGCSFSRISPMLPSKSARKRSSLPTCMPWPFLPSTQCPSHCFSCGQTRPHTAGRLLFSLMMCMALPKFPIDNSWIQSGMSWLIGHPFLHCGTLQCRQRLASSIASCIVYPSLTSLNNFFSCSILLLAFSFVEWFHWVSKHVLLQS